MNKNKSSLLILVTLFLSTTVMASDSALELATNRGCFICHNVQVNEDDHNPLAPAYQEIAERYRGREDAFQYLVGRVLHGTLYTEQNWKNEISMRFMPPNVNVSRAEAGELTNWILRLPVDKAMRERIVHQEKMLILSTRSGCMACHLMDAPTDARLMPLAPGFREIARRYRDDPDARKKLVKSIVSGTRSATKIWQNVNMQFMPPNVGLERKNAEQLADWILGLE
jgi:cytochrome c551/c552